jgi:peptide-methionine (S)-S-oxide reductase
MPVRENKGQINVDDSKEVATLAGGCFWCLEAIYNELKGVGQVIAGYTGGTEETPSYHDVCTGATGHAEAVQIYFNSKIISFRELLEVFFSIHDPTTLNRQGADVGTQYRSAIFYHNDRQREIAEQLIEEMTSASIWTSPIVTEVTSFRHFYPAEDYHQQYFKRNSDQPYCHIVIEPKLEHFRRIRKTSLK